MGSKSMDVFVGEYRALAAPFTTIHAEDLRVDGVMVVNKALDADLLGLDEPLRVRAISDGHRDHLPWQHEQVVQGRGRDVP